ncbi:hypothetical protein ABIB86_000393 [Bradyrhizobium sp. JR1.7]|uniref:hypothetical protein n=1 Tax=unclassified Bradyrhizobium TaxID=2631580 RepID=UPI003393E50C
MQPPILPGHHPDLIEHRLFDHHQKGRPMPKTVKLSDVEIGIGKMRAAIEPSVSEPGQRGVTARAMLAILPAAARWGAHEFNMDTPLEQTMQGLATAVCNMLASDLDNSETTIDEKVEGINAFLRMVMGGTYQILAHKNPDRAFIAATEGGNA